MLVCVERKSFEFRVTEYSGQWGLHEFEDGSSDNHVYTNTTLSDFKRCAASSALHFERDD